MTRICVSLTEETTTGMIDRMVDLAGVADLFEIRSDRVLDLDLLTLLRARYQPLVFTCRPKSEGGRFEGDEQDRRRLLMEAAKRGFDYVDVEYRSGFLEVMVEKSGRGLVLSHHDLEGTPADLDLDALYTGMAALGADIVKIAVTPRSVADVGRLLDFAAQVARGGGPPLVAIALGPLGLPSRILGGRYGAPFTYASASAGQEGGPGQLTAKVLAGLYRVHRVNPATRVYGILGADVTRSLSPMIHNRAFEARQIDAVFVPLQAEDLLSFLRALPALGLAGFAVTRPYKVDIVPHLQSVDEAATVAGSVNTVVVKDGRLEGSTTDGRGVVGALKKKTTLAGKRVVVLGAGGAARAAALALRLQGADVLVLARRASQAAEVAAAIGCRCDTLASLPGQAWDVLVNATPVGSAAMPDQSLVPAKLHRPGTVAFDMVYDPLETPFLREAQAAGCTTIDGLQMLLAQASAQFELWTGMEAPADVMRSVALFIAQEQAS